MTFFVAELAALFFVFGKERERKEREPVTGEMRRNAGEDRAGTQGWQGSCQVAMPGEASGDARLPSAGSDAPKNIGGRNARKSVRGRKARFAGKLLLVQRCLRQRTAELLAHSVWRCDVDFVSGVATLTSSERNLYFWFVLYNLLNRNYTFVQFGGLDETRRFFS